MPALRFTDLFKNGLSPFLKKEKSTLLVTALTRKVHIGTGKEIHQINSLEIFFRQSFEVSPGCLFYFI